MQYAQMVKKVEGYNGFSEKESERALRLFVEKLAARLTEGERKDFASQLPTELSEVVLSSVESDRGSAGNFYDEFSKAQKTSKPYAKIQIHAVWEVLQEGLSDGQVKDVKSQLPKDLVEELA